MNLKQRIQSWKSRLEETLRVLSERGAEVDEVFCAGPPGPRVLSDAEVALGRALPRSLLDIFAHQVALRGSWRLPKDLVRLLPEETQEVEWGQIDLSVREVVTAEESRRDWVRECFPNPDDEYDRVWHDKFAFMTVPNGDCLAVLEEDPECPVYYLSHDDGEGHGVRLAPSLLSFLDRFSRLAFVGPEDWLLLPFVREGFGLDPTLASARGWRAAVGLDAICVE